MPASVPELTVIEHLRLELDGRARADGASGAADRAWDEGAVPEPRDRARCAAAEQRRLLMVADRAARRWSPAMLEVVQRPDLAELLRRVKPIEDALDVTTARDVVLRVQQQLRETPSDALASRLGRVERALRATDSVRELLVEVGRGDPEAPAATRELAVPHAAEALIRTWRAEGLPDGGMLSEIRRLTHGLDALAFYDGPLALDDQDGRSGVDRDVHDQLVRSLVGWTGERGWTITHAEGSRTAPRPPRVGRHRPDVMGRTADGTPFIGEAKVGPDLREARTAEQLADFLRTRPDGQVLVVLQVPGGWRAAAQSAAEAPGADLADLHVHELHGIAGAPSPPTDVV